MAALPAPRTARRRALAAILALAVVAAVVGTGFSVPGMMRARALLASQRLGAMLRLTAVGQPPDLLLAPDIKADRVVTRQGPGAGERTEVRTYGQVRVTIQFSPAQPGGVVTRIEGRLSPMEWPSNRRHVLRRG